MAESDDTEWSNPKLYGTNFEIPYNAIELFNLRKIGVFLNNMPFFQDSLFHHRLATYVDYHKIEGDIVECGVYNGMSAASFAVALNHKKNNSRIWLFDSWEGFPQTNDVKDGEVAPTLAGKIKGSLEGVKERMSNTGFPIEDIIYRKGWFIDTFKDPLPEKISLLHIDCDFYQSVLLSLKTFYHKVVHGGLIILDDFGAFPGCRVAFYEFCEENKIRPLIRSYDHTRIFWNKTNFVESNIDHTTLMSNDWQNYIKLSTEHP